MATIKGPIRPLAICSSCLKSQKAFSLPVRPFSATVRQQQPDAATQTATASNPPPLIPTDQLDPNTVSTVSEEARLLKHKKMQPLGSRRRRAALRALGEDAIPFEQLPYQCFQEARALLAEDRREKVTQIEKMRRRIKHVEEAPVDKVGGERYREHRLISMRRELESLKILADINDPLVKKRFEDGFGDMNKPIYRHLANTKWRSYKRKVLMQRITQMSVVPDVFPEIDPVLDMDMSWHRRTVAPGDFVPSNWSEQPPALRIQKFDKGVAKYTIVAVDSDVPNLETDAFDYRCHGVWTDIEVSPSQPNVGFLGTAGTVVLPWTPPYAQKGSPYHRISIFVLEQTKGASLSQEQLEKIKAGANDASFLLRGLVATTKFKPVGVTMFRIQWDEHMKGVMERNGIEGADVEFRRAKPEKLPQKYQVKDGLRYRGWKK